jgi:hypothetical protein
MIYIPNVCSNFVQNVFFYQSGGSIRFALSLDLNLSPILLHLGHEWIHVLVLVWVN